MTEDVSHGWGGAGGIWAKFVRGGNDFYRDHMTLPAFLSLVGDLRGLRVLDVGCGEGHVARLLTKAGARVTGVDISPTMIAEARKMEASHPLGIAYFESDARSMPMLADAAFDAAISYQTLMDIEDYQSAASEVSRVLRPGGRFYIAMIHPCFATRTSGGEKTIGWETATGPDGAVEYTHLNVSDYFHRSAEEWLWQNRVERPFVTAQYNRTLSDYVNALGRSGLLIDGMIEPKPTEEGVRLHPALKRFQRVPHDILISAVKK